MARLVVLAVSAAVMAWASASALQLLTSLWPRACMAPAALAVALAVATAVTTRYTANGRALRHTLHKPHQQLLQWS